MNLPIPLGTVIKPYGKVAAVGWVGERYYWLVKEGCVSMIPAAVLEPMLQEAGLPK